MNRLPRYLSVIVAAFALAASFAACANQSETVGVSQPSLSPDSTATTLAPAVAGDSDSPWTSNTGVGPTVPANPSESTWITAPPPTSRASGDQPATEADRATYEDLLNRPQTQTTILMDDIPPPSPDITAPPTPLEEPLIGSWDIDRSLNRFAGVEFTNRGVSFFPAAEIILENYRDWVVQAEGFAIGFQDGNCNGNGSRTIDVTAGLLTVDQDSTVGVGQTAVGCSQQYPEQLGEIKKCLDGAGCEYTLDGDRLTIVGADATHFEFTRSSNT
ncbi:MAG: hypothetical protein KAZ88_11395 [Acidimicrobiia bacterium]|jgi:hypothetical protein|nr:hypothetical protein [Acidimicrobiia bacterium]